ncbi:methyl-accepting chemotaxis protein [Roseobacter sinensis]|uniref:Methyl-accepting chemotaxis protein n=1 Tax=Roseobacter sinensis TaxID=2931391 RepID=A0ABT3BLH4_9RHOB|nr:methyl-accepting chemotaxis protein [Roseobacter sp. WL0113]MCV3274427.1 methyl-accepting chemotaxis protein [Roseobacter sp. WL0113]
MSIVMRIYLGMGAMIALVVIVGGFASYQTNRLADTFVEYRGTAKTSLIANELTEDLFEARLDSSKYRITKDRKYIDGYNGRDGVIGNIEEIVELSPELIEMMEGYPEQVELTNIADLLIEYETSMEAAYEKQTERDAYVEETAELGKKAREQLSEIMETALRDNDPQAAAVAGRVSSHLLLARLYLERFLIDNKESDGARADEEIELARNGMTDLLRELQNPRRRELAQATIDDLAAFDTAKEAVINVISERNAIYARMDEIGPETLSRMETALNAVVDRQNTLGPAGAAMAQRSIVIVSVFVVIGAIIGGILAFFTARIIASSLTRITEDMGELADGNLDVEIEPSKDEHEIGKMTNAMVVFLDNARKARDLDLEVKEKEKKERELEEANRAREAELEKERRAVEEREREAERARMQTLENFQKDMERVLGEAASGDFSNRMSKDIDDEALVGLADVINKLLEQTEANIDDIVRSIGELSQGNLGIRIDGDRQGAFLRMKDDFNAALTTLSATMAEIMDSGQNVSETSVHLEKSSNDMAKRAEDNAAAVEETSAAVEQITASIRQVVTNAKSADEATRKVRESADKTRQVSDETEASINAMTEASAQINRVVKVIEDIAFQINLLALNAGVEAARAGEAGRGFSVVASEVRALAQRSQEAVQEISQVIDQNNQSVEVGVEQVALSRKALEEIIGDVEVASDQISEIAMAVEQQSVGIEEVNTAVRSIDKTAQTNAASLEEMTAASVSMSKEATTLAKALQQFHGVSKSETPAKKPKAETTVAASADHPAQPRRTAAVAGGQPVVDESWEEF